MPQSSWRAILALVLAATHVALAAFPDCANGPLKNNLICNTSADAVSRAKALVSELTLEEMANNTVNAAFGVPRLGLPAYNWWSEALHGVALSPGTNFSTQPGQPFSSATSFPQPIIISASFDDELVNAIATVISTEARAFNNAGRAGLDFFTPNINPFKDPRWGRGQETPGEDPFHIAQYVYQLVTGLQGGLSPDPYYKVVADCKHFAGYDLENWHGNSRMAFNAIISTQDLAEFYTPSFQSCVRDAHVGSVMCSYNAVNGIPSCASPYLLQNIVREQFGLDGWITSDCDAVENVFDPHGYTTTATNASAVSMKAGTDVDCGTTYSSTLVDAVNQGLVDEDHIKTAMTRLYTSLVKLGYFDPADKQPLRQLGWSDVNTPPAQALALTAAEEGIVLLKNDGVLPFARSVKKIAVVGPMANATTQMQGNYQGIAPFLISPFDGLKDAGFQVTLANGTTVTGTDTSGFAAAVAAAKAADAVVYVGGIDETVESEGNDRTSISWPGNQLDLISELEQTGKPLVVVQLGGGQVDSSSLKSSKTVNALIWAGYPGQSGGTALANILSGKTAPAGRLPITQYPADYVNEIPMTDMALRPHDTSPGRTYKWYTGTTVFPFGAGEHYTTFAFSWASPPPAKFAISDLIASASHAGVAHTDLAPLGTFKVNVKNTGRVASDYVALLFSNTTAGPAPAPRQQLVAYTRVKGVAPGRTATATLTVKLGQIARVDEDGNSALYPGTYNVWLDTTGEIVHSFELTGERTQIINWPQPS